MTSFNTGKDLVSLFKKRALVLVYGSHMLESYDESEHVSIYDAITTTGMSEYKGQPVPLPGDFEHAPVETPPALLEEAYKAIYESAQALLDNHYMVTYQLGSNDVDSMFILANSPSEAESQCLEAVKVFAEAGEEIYLEDAVRMNERIKIS